VPCVNSGMDMFSWLPERWPPHATTRPVCTYRYARCAYLEFTTPQTTNCLRYGTVLDQWFLAHGLLLGHATPAEVACADGVDGDTSVALGRMRRAVFPPSPQLAFSPFLKLSP